MKPLPPPSQLDYLLFTQYLLGNEDKLSQSGRDYMLELVAERRGEGTIFTVNYTNGEEGLLDVAVLVATTLPGQRIDYYHVHRGSWQAKLEQWYERERKARQKRLTAETSSDATGVPA